MAPVSEIQVQAPGETKAAQIVEAPVQQDIEGVEPPAATGKAERKPRQPRRRKAPEPIVADLSTAGLEMVETRTDVAKVEPIVEEPKPRAPAKPAAWQKKVAAPADEPLVMVETQK
jgi:ribonuclease E